VLATSNRSEQLQQHQFSLLASLLVLLEVDPSRITAIMTPQSTDKVTKKVDFKALPEVIECVVKPIKQAIAQGDGDFVFLSAKKLVWSHEDLKNYRAGGDGDFVAFSNWYGKYIYEQKKQLKKATMAGNNKKAAAKPPKASLSPVPLNKDEMDILKEYELARLATLKSVAETTTKEACDGTNKTAKVLMDSAGKSNSDTAEKVNSSVKKTMEEWGANFSNTLKASARKR